MTEVSSSKPLLRRLRCDLSLPEAYEVTREAAAEIERLTALLQIEENSADTADRKPCEALTLLERVMRKVNELLGPSCLTSAADDEPIFVLRANDELAPAIVREWAHRYTAAKAASQGDLTKAQCAKRDEALRLADEMDVWKRAAVEPGESHAEWVETPTPAWSQDCKERAYKLDPECWVSYSGKPKKFKQLMDQRRTASLKRAAEETGEAR